MFVYYKCRCMADEVTVFVRDRKDDEDVADWVQSTLGMAMGADHASRNPLCRSSSMEYVKIPVDQGEDARIGKLRRN
jgi:hypothetical protein